MPSPKSHPEPPTSVHHTPPSAESGDARSGPRQPAQTETLRQNSEGRLTQGHPDAPAGQHATGSFTGNSGKKKRA